MASAGSITWDLIANSSKFVQELERANKSARQWGDKLAKVTKDAAKSFVAVGTAATASMAAIYAATASSIDEQAKFAARIGISTEALGGLQHAADLTGVSTNAMNTGLQRMTRRIAEAGQGTGVAVDALERLNLQVDDLVQKTPDQQFLAIADAMGNVESRSEQVRLAFKLFDSDGVALLNTLDMTADGIKDATKEAVSLGIALNDIDASKVETANDAFDNATKISKGFSRHLTVELAPIVQGMSVEFLNAANEAGGMAEVTTKAIDSMVGAVGVLANSWRGLEIIFLGLKVLVYQLAVDSIAVIRNIEYQAKGVVNSWREFFGQELMAMNRELTQSSIELTMELNEAKKALIDLSSMELPSDQVRAYVHEWRELSEAQAIANVEAKKYNETVKDLFSDDDDDQEDTLQFWKDLRAHIESTTQDFDAMWGRTFDRFSSRFGDAVADAIVEGENFNDAMNQIAIAFSKSMIAALTEIATRQAVLWLLDKTILKSAVAAEGSKTTTEAMVGVEMSALNAFRSTAAIPVYGPAAAPAAAATARGLAMPMATAAIAAANSGIAGIAHSGIDNIPERGTWLLDRGERVLSSKQNEDLKQFLNQKQGGDVIQQEINSTLVVEAGAGQDRDAEFAQAVSDDLYRKLIDDARTNGPLRRAMMG